jgi:hypothetical protein
MGLVNHLVVMVKAPRLGAVKTRLAREIGAVAARRFYRASSAAVLARLGHDPRWRCWLAVTPDRFAAASAFWPRRLPRLPQGPGDLGQRMARPLKILPPGPVVIVGSDIPGLGAGHVARAFTALGRHDLVFGPAEDGGYWLVGARRRPPPPPELFRAVRWSSAHALEDTLANLGPRFSVAFVERLSDVDNAADYARWRLLGAGPGQAALGSSPGGR